MPKKKNRFFILIFLSCIIVCVVFEFIKLFDYDVDKKYTIIQCLLSVFLFVYVLIYLRKKWVCFFISFFMLIINISPLIMILPIYDREACNYVLHAGGV